MKRRGFLRLAAGVALAPFVGVASAKQPKYLFTTGHKDFIKPEYADRRYAAAEVIVTGSKIPEYNGIFKIVHINGRKVMAGDIVAGEPHTIKFDGKQFVLVDGSLTHRWSGKF